MYLYPLGDRDSDFSPDSVAILKGFFFSSFSPPFPAKVEKAERSEVVKGGAKRRAERSGASLDNERSGAKMSVWGKGGGGLFLSGQVFCIFAKKGDFSVFLG